MENSKIKPGWQTTEFWMALIGFVLGVLVLVNLLNQDEAAEWQALFAATLPAVLPTFAYIAGRAKIKTG